MPVRILTIASSLILLVLMIAFIGHAVGSEYYLFLPGRTRGLHEPPTSPWAIGLLIAISIGVFFASRRYAATIFAMMPLLALLGLPVGILFFEWTPGIAQYLLIFSLGGLATFVWYHECLNED